MSRCRRRRWPTSDQGYDQPVVWHNHTGNQSCNPRQIVTPGPGLHDLVELVKRAEREGTTVRAVGAGHSWSDVTLTDGYLIEPLHLSGLLPLEEDTLRAEMRQRSLCASSAARRCTS